MTEKGIEIEIETEKLSGIGDNHHQIEEGLKGKIQYKIFCG